MKFLEGITPREYQQKIFETCRDKNCLVVLPTGLGKTLIALMLSIDRLEKFPNEKIVILAPTKPLVEQHFNYFKKHLPELFAEVEMFTGQINSDKRKKLWETSNIVFSTPQCVANDLKKRLYTLRNVSLLIEDEAHRCLKNYDYNIIAQKYKEDAENQRIVGLTASPGSEKEKIKEICRNLSIEEVEFRSRESDDVKKYIQTLEFERVMVDFPEGFNDVRVAISRIFDRYISELRARHLLFGPPTKIELLKVQKKISNLLKGNYEKNFNTLLGASACAQALKVQYAQELLETQTLRGFNEYLNKLIEQASKSKTKGTKKLVSQPEFNFALRESSSLLYKNQEHPKIAKLVELAQSAFEKNPKTKILVFSQYRDTASILADELNKLSGINSKIFVGQAKKTNKHGSTGLSQKEQKKVIAEFSSGEINVLCATSIGEEGLDIPEVSLVIFYEPVPSVIRSIQRAGRTARLAKGKLIVLITKKTRDENYYYVSRSREKKMQSEIESLKNNLDLGFQESIDKFIK